MADIITDPKELCLRSLKRTHAMYLSNYGQRAPDFEESSKLRVTGKVLGEYRMVKDLPPPGAGGAAKGPATSGVAPGASAPSQGLLTDKSAGAKANGAGGSTSLVKVGEQPATNVAISSW